MDGRRRQGERERRPQKSQQEKERGDYKEAKKKGNPGSRRKLGYRGFTILLPRFAKLSSTRSFASSHGEAIDKNGW